MGNQQSSSSRSSRPSTPKSSSKSKSKSSKSSKSRDSSRDRRILHMVACNTHHEGTPKPSKIRLKHYDLAAIRNAEERAAFSMAVDFEDKLRQDPHFNPSTHPLWNYMTKEERKRFKGLLDKEGRVIATKEEREMWKKGFEQDWDRYWEGASGPSGRQPGQMDNGYNNEDDAFPVQTHRSVQVDRMPIPPRPSTSASTKTSSAPIPPPSPPFSPSPPSPQSPFTTTFPPSPPSPQQTDTTVSRPLTWKPVVADGYDGGKKEATSEERTPSTKHSSIGRIPTP
ncbi:hypothetical protein V8C37DRAFT_287217 [Trichoderma ceciliae]